VAVRLRKLTDRQIKGRLEPGRHSDGGGLFLAVSKSGARSWVFLWKTGGRRREMGLGSLNAVPLAQARVLAEKARQDCAAGRDPIAVRDAAVSKTFGEIADELIAIKAPEWRNEKHADQWRMTLAVYCAPIRAKEVASIQTDDVLNILRPLWLTRRETASRLRARIEAVLDAAKAKGLRTGENPARWRGHLDLLLSKRKKLDRPHHPAMAYKEVPAFLAALREQPTVAALALEFVILTAARSGEALGASWSEIDLSQKLWVVPGERMKGGREHRVPLSDRVLEILAEAERLRDGEFVFPGEKRGKPLSINSLARLLRQMKVENATPHGFRSSFRNFAGNETHRDSAGRETHFPREIAELSLAHLVGDETERAYRRDDALERRRHLMNAWAQYLNLPDNVIPMAECA
jgi:integrase